MSNCLFVGNGGYGIDNGGGITLSYGGAFDNASGDYSNVTCDPGCSSIDPALSFIATVENTPYANIGAGGSAIGANIINRYVDGVLTTDILWPWPNEDFIKEDMCAAVGETRGFCSATSLTDYIWGYLGNPSPY